MTDKKKYYKLDDIGIVGTQEKRSPASYRYHSRKTGKILRQFKEDQAVIKLLRIKKIS